MPTLKPLIVILGGVREVPIGGVKKDTRTHGSRRSLKTGGTEAMETVTQGKIVRLHPEQWRASHRFVRNANFMLQQMGYQTPLGRITLAAKKNQVLNFREIALKEAVEHNTLNRYWQVVVEISPVPLNVDAVNQLLTIYGGQLPELFFEPDQPVQGGVDAS